VAAARACLRAPVEVLEVRLDDLGQQLVGCL
jgi:hypothetical protein